MELRLANVDPSPAHELNPHVAHYRAEKEAALMRGAPIHELRESGLGYKGTPLGMNPVALAIGGISLHDTFVHPKHAGS